MNAATKLSFGVVSVRLSAHAGDTRRSQATPTVDTGLAGTSGSGVTLPS